ncbi:MAG: hypothetical protein LBI95_03840 [Holosporales bacterium]|nr:hypothetical protein [Holosporales bacterium]
MVYSLFRLSRLSHVKFEAGRAVLKLLNQLFHVEHLCLRCLDGSSF